MHLRDLLRELDSLKHCTNGWTATDVEAVELTPWGLSFGAGVSNDLALKAEELAQEVKGLEETVKAAEQAQREAEERADAAEQRLEELLTELETAKEEGTGISAAEYRERAERAAASEAQAHEHTRQANRHVEEMTKELTAIRKRKGVEPGLMAHSWEVSGFLNTVASYGSAYQLDRDNNTRRSLEYLGEQAVALRKRIDATAKAGHQPKAAA